jgi:drug/metabolite transporter (DMT)-like permease
VIAAILTSFFFALSAISSMRSTRYLGSQRANLARQIVALVCLGLWVHLFGEGIHAATFWLFFISGILGFGLGDWALFESYQRLGPALSMLFCQCLAVPIAVITEWIWIGTRMSWMELAASAVILLGVILAMAPEHDADVPRGHRIAGTFLGIAAATGQAWGAVLSRYAFQRAHEEGLSLNGVTAAYQRLWGGVITVSVLLTLRHVTREWHSPGKVATRPDWGRGWPWILANATAGAIFGMVCYQTALKTAPSALVLPIVATTPLVVMLIVFVFEGVKPKPRAVVGAVIAVVGVVALVANH